jgi:hypothetical protein
VLVLLRGYRYLKETDESGEYTKLRTHTQTQARRQYTKHTLKQGVQKKKKQEEKERLRASSANMAPHRSLQQQQCSHNDSLASETSKAHTRCRQNKKVNHERQPAEGKKKRTAAAYSWERESDDNTPRPTTLQIVVSAPFVLHRYFLLLFSTSFNHAQRL